MVVIFGRWTHSRMIMFFYRSRDARVVGIMLKPFPIDF